MSKPDPWVVNPAGRRRFVGSVADWARHRAETLAARAANTRKRRGAR